MSRDLASLPPPSILTPALRAYVLAYLTSASPRLLGLFLAVARGKLDIRFALTRLQTILRQHAAFDRFPTTCAFLVAGSTIVPRVITQLLRKVGRQRHLSLRSGEYWVKFLATAASSYLCFSLLNRRPSRPIDFHAESADQHLASRQSDGADPPIGRRRRASSVQLASTSSKDIFAENIPPLAGRTLDLTLFAFVHAVGVLVASQWSKYRARPSPHTDSAFSLESLASPSLFAFSSCIIMFNWFFSPDRLPSSYRNWISSAAQIDPRLIEALRQCRYGSFIYGKDTGMGPLLRGMCRDLGYPEVWGDPAITIPVPCELYHSGTGPSCEWHAIVRFVRGWKFAMKMYLPLNLLMLSRRDRSKRSFGRVFIEASQSSAFLGAFVAAFYYGVCLARTRVGPKLFSSKTVTPMMWDGGLCVGTGCVACGWSILLEKPARRQEIALFVAPRALATICPRRYPRQHMWREQLTFALSAATILVAAQENPSHVQGVFGRLMSQVFR